MTHKFRFLSKDMKIFEELIGRHFFNCVLVILLSSRSSFLDIVGRKIGCFQFNIQICSFLHAVQSAYILCRILLLFLISYLIVNEEKCDTGSD